MSSPNDDARMDDLHEGNDQTLQRALSILQEKGQEPSIRLDALRFIIDQFETNYFPVLEGLLNDDSEHPDVRSAAALALGKVGGDNALNTLMAHVKSNDITVKNYTLQALGILGREEGIPLLVNALHDSNNTIFASAAEALGEIGKPAVPHLIAILENSEASIKDDMRCIAAWQLGQLKYSEAIPALTKAIKTYNNPEIQALCIWALGEIGISTPEILDALHWARQQSDTSISDRAKMAIQKITRHLN